MDDGGEKGGDPGVTNCLLLFAQPLKQASRPESLHHGPPSSPSFYSLNNPCLTPVKGKTISPHLKV